ncbi:MAG: DUF5367 family protein [Muricauda sp.]|jgi:hypothetical protein|nr:DUF5367 family protein [Allomuricauda sp.]MBO6532941.1 DUF5367 family protein [Allomuricauda sp.]MBO6588886.1 DUF5367 family protein [Allomuricauda sp.]MBO6618511.1 DUF5367 family protein [Allomuricauda sp.]MBO6644424.1 DUF5367 family protein [Allomuricauda sp.]MBO6746324.1 DUF5367 family protein [Allomuricauda sp.]
MKHVRAIGIGIFIWIIGVSLYTFSFYIPILENPELQANIFLSIGVVPLVWFGSKLYYRKNNTTKGYWLGLVFFLIAAVLDALVTVPLFIEPYGGSYYSFFTAIGFWLIGMEFVITATCYWYVEVYGKKETVNS